LVAAQGFEPRTCGL